MILDPLGTVNRIPQAIRRLFTSGYRCVVRLAKCPRRQRKAWACVKTDGRGERIRTSGLYVPNVALYQAKLHPAMRGATRRQTLFPSAESLDRLST